MIHVSQTRPSARNNLGNRNIQKSQVSVLWNCGIVRIISRRGGDIICVHNARFVEEQLVNNVGNNVGTKSEGQ